MARRAAPLMAPCFIAESPRRRVSICSVSASTLLLLASVTSGAQLQFPEPLTRPHERAAWLAEEAEKNQAVVDAELALPIARRSRAKLAAAAQRDADIHALAEKIPGGVSIPWTGAEEALKRVDAYLAEQKTAAGYAAAAKAREDQRLAAIRSGGYPADEARRLEGREVWIGMTTEQAMLSWGKPQRASERITAAGKTEVWRYGGSLLTFSNGKVVAIDREK